MPLGMYALRLAGAPDVAEDLVQDAFLKAWVYMEDGGEIQNFTAFMYRTVRNVCISYLRSLHETVGEDAVVDLPDQDSDVGKDEIDTSFRDARIWKVIDELPARCREVFLRSKRDGLTNEQIAEDMGISVKTVKNQMTKAYSRLRQALDPIHKPFFFPFL